MLGPPGPLSGLLPPPIHNGTPCQGFVYSVMSCQHPSAILQQSSIAMLTLGSADLQAFIIPSLWPSPDLCQFLELVACVHFWVLGPAGLRWDPFLSPWRHWVCFNMVIYQVGPCDHLVKQRTVKIPGLRIVLILNCGRRGGDLLWLLPQGL